MNETRLSNTNTLKPYPEYKESGQRWLGNIPAHWALLPNRAIFFEVKDRNHDKEEMLSVTITRGIIRQKFLLNESSKKDSSNLNKSAYKLVMQNDIAYNKMRAWQGALGASSFQGIISPAYVVMRPKVVVNPWFFHYLYRTSFFAKEAERWSYGITSDMWSLRPEHFKIIVSVLPSLGEQTTIVRFLDHTNRKIDGFIRAKKKLIDLLNEQKHAIIQQAVTRGLNPNVKLKPSGIPWLGQIPEDWEIRPIKQVLIQMDYGTSEASVDDGKYRVLTMGHIQNGRIVIPKKGGINRIPVGLSLKEKDLLFNRTNSPDLVGKVGIFEGPEVQQITFASYLVRLRVRPEYNPFWLNYLLNSNYFWAFARSQAYVSLHQANLSSSRYGRMSIPIPPRLMQNLIVSKIQELSGVLDVAISRAEREITLMQEYRARLTADVVTGKLDVREAAARLPEVVESSDSVSDVLDSEEEIDETEGE